jgi:hypothetical protein
MRTMRHDVELSWWCSARHDNSDMEKLDDTNSLGPFLVLMMPYNFPTTSTLRAVNSNMQCSREPHDESRECVDKNVGLLDYADNRARVILVA